MTADHISRAGFSGGATATGSRGTRRTLAGQGPPPRYTPSAGSATAGKGRALIRYVYRQVISAQKTSTSKKKKWSAELTGGGDGGGAGADCRVVPMATEGWLHTVSQRRIGKSWPTRADLKSDDEESRT